MRLSPGIKILLLTPQLPYPPDQGTSLRNYHILRGLALEHEIDLLSFVEEGQDEALAREHLVELCERIVTIEAPQRSLRQRLVRLVTDGRPDMAHRLQSYDFERALEQMLGDKDYDIVQIEGIELAPHIEFVRRRLPTSKVVFDDHNAEAELQRRMFTTDLRSPLRWIPAIYSFIQWRRLRGFERQAIRGADGVSVVSETDAAHLLSLAPEVRLEVIPNCIDVQRYNKLGGPNAESVPSDILFIGKMDYRPNVDAVIWFGTEIWPLIRQRNPHATWTVVGKHPHPRLAQLASSPGVVVTGGVPDILPYLAGAQVYVMPFRIGSGTRLKLVEALASGIATVSTHVGAEGYPLRDGEHIVLEDAPMAFAAAVVDLLENQGRREALGAAGRVFAQQYDWRQVIPAFNNLYKDLLSG